MFSYLQTEGLRPNSTEFRGCLVMAGVQSTLRTCCQ